VRGGNSAGTRSAWRTPMVSTCARPAPSNRGMRGMRQVVGTS
jgi:hypothetical protein